jgi:ABC-2 type transport system permease protein
VRRILAIVALRFKLLARRVQGPGGALNLAGAILLAVLGVAFALGLAVGLGVLIHVFVTSGDSRKLLIGFLIVFYVSLVLGVVLPLLRGAMDQGFDASPFLIFPIGRGRLYAVTLAACFGTTDHLLYYPMLAAVAFTGVLLPGVNVVVGLALIALCIVFFVVWGNALALFLVSVMRARRIREFAGILGLMLLIGASLIPATWDSSDDRLKNSIPQLTAALDVALRAGRVLPPSIAAESLTALHAEGGGARAATGVLGMLLWNAAGFVIGYFVFDRYHLGERGVRVARRARRRSAASGALGGLLTLDGRLFSPLPSEVRAVAAKDLHYLFRSVLGRFNLFMLPIFVLFVVFVVGRSLDEPVFGIDPEPLLLFGLLLYTVLFSNNFLNNSLAWEGDGVKSYYLGPVSLRRILVGKNLAVWLYNCLLFGMVIVPWSLVKGPPGPLTLLSAVLMFASAVVIFTSCGNIISVVFPVPRDMSTIRNQPSQVAVLLSLLVLAAAGLVIGPMLSVPMLLGWSAAQPLFLAVLLAAAIGLYSLTLGQAAHLLHGRRERIIDTLKSAR